MIGRTDDKREAGEENGQRLYPATYNEEFTSYYHHYFKRSLLLVISSSLSTRTIPYPNSFVSRRSRDDNWKTCRVYSWTIFLFYFSLQCWSTLHPYLISCFPLPFHPSFSPDIPSFQHLPVPTLLVSNTFCSSTSYHSCSSSLLGCNASLFQPPSVPTLFRSDTRFYIGLLFPPSSPSNTFLHPIPSPFSNCVTLIAID